MNWDKNNNDNNPWGSGDGNNPWGSDGNGPNNKMDFEDSIKKARDKFGRFKFGGKKNLSIFILIAILVWLATGFYRVEPDEQGVNFYLVNGTAQQSLDFTTSFLPLLEKLLPLK